MHAHAHISPCIGSARSGRQRPPGCCDRINAYKTKDGDGREHAGGLHLSRKDVTVDGSGDTTVLVAWRVAEPTRRVLASACLMHGQQCRVGVPQLHAVATMHEVEDEDHRLRQK